MAPAPPTVSRLARWLSRSWRLPTGAGRWLGRGKPRNPQHELGERGERLAARWLRRHGYKVLYRRFRPREGGEIDLVCRHKDTLVFVEVKTRTGMAFGRPADAVDAAKQALLGRGARAWLRLLRKPEVPIRFDIVEVLILPGREPECHILPDAFHLP